MKKRKKKVYNPIKAAQSAARKNHFAKGGTCATWRGRAQTFDDVTKVADKKKCRGRVDENS